MLKIVYSRSIYREMQCTSTSKQITDFTFFSYLNFTMAFPCVLFHSDRLIIFWHEEENKNMK